MAVAALPVAAFLATAAFFCWGFVLRVSPSVMTGELMRDFAIGAGALGQLSALYYYAYAVLQVPVGVLLDRIGPRRLLTLALLTASCGAATFGISDSIALAAVGRTLIGIGCAFSWVGVLTVIGRSFPPRLFARLAGIAQFGGVGGGVLGQAPLGLLVLAAGWRPTLGILAGIGGVLAIAIWLLLRDSGRRAGDEPPRPLLEGLRLVTRNPQTWAAAAFGFFMSAPLQGFAALWAVPFFMTAHGVDREAAALTATCMSIGYACGAPLIGLVADRIGRRPVMIAGSFACAAMLALATQTPGLPLAAARGLMLAAGVSSSVMFLGFVCGREQNPPAVTGVAVGLVNTAVMCSGALFQPLIGLLLDLGWTGVLLDGARQYSLGAYRAALAVIPLCALAGGLTAWSLREPRRVA